MDKEENIENTVLALARKARDTALQIEKRTRRILEEKDTLKEHREPDGSIIDELLALIEELETIESETRQLIPAKE